MGSNVPARIATPAPYKPPAKVTEPIITWLFRKSIKRGKVTLQFANRTVDVGSGEPICTIAPPSFQRFLWMLLKPDYRLPSHYTYGYWCCEKGKLYVFLELLTAQQESPLHWWFRLWNRSPVRDQFVYRLFPIKVKERIAQHYNTNPDFMRRILGQHLEYTCAFFEGPNDTLNEAQAKKINKVIERLSVTESDKVIDLGCGWGQIAEAVHSNTGAQVTGVNITPNQIAHARKNASDGTTFVLSDYEAFRPEKSFSKLYSIGMVEHIGWGKLETYFSKISDLLSDDGSALVHCIVRTKEGSTNSWIDREVFPGAYIPELAEVVKAIDRSPLQIEMIYTHDKSNYFRTLRAWTENLYANWDDLVDIIRGDVSEREAQVIMRIWEFYLNGSQLVFNNYTGYCYNVQIALSCQKRGSLER